MLVNEPDHGSGIKRVFPPPRSFVRILPNRWNGSDDLDRHDLLIEMHEGFSWGATVGGVLTYPGSILYADTSKVHAITKRFETTGELWATRTDLARKYGDHLCIRGDTIPEEWLKYLAYALPHITKGGGEWPLKVRLGVVGLSGCHWPTDGASGRPPVALKSELTTEFTLREKSVEEIWLAILNAWRDFRKIFSMPHPSQVAQEKAKHFLTTVIGDSLI